MLYYLYECVQIIDKVSNVLCLVGQSWYIIVLFCSICKRCSSHTMTLQAKLETTLSFAASQSAAVSQRQQITIL